MSTKIEHKKQSDYFQIKIDGVAGTDSEGAKRLTISNMADRKAAFYRKRRQTNGKVTY